MNEWIMLFSDKNVILKLLFRWRHPADCCSDDVNFVALEEIRFNCEFDLEESGQIVAIFRRLGLIYRISSIGRYRNMRFNNKTVPFEDTNWPEVEISRGNSPRAEMSSKNWIRAKRHSIFDERILLLGRWIPKPKSHSEQNTSLKYFD